MNNSHHHSGHPHSALIQELINCALSCEKCLTACLEESDVTMMAHCIELDKDCADICFLAARLLQRDSEIGHKFLLICEEICRLCAAECSKHEHEHCKVCAEACEKCAEACHAHHGEVHLA
ncbi:MAG: four-helix bundle copper-binding protein [Opitutaceae bacterium]|nr:four-helix bundle copper-binding protein [Cytophagales bacterium]